MSDSRNDSWLLGMYPKPIQKLIDCFATLPGIGPRAAGRFVFALLKQDPEFLKEFGNSITALPTSVSLCAQCFKSIEHNAGTKLCVLCQNSHRAKDSIMVLEKEADLAAIEKSGTFKGLYHILGGTISALDADSPKKLKIRELYTRIAGCKKNSPDTEVILATNPTPDGDMTANYVERILEPLTVKITRLGRGITAGSELEYTDENTIAHAFKNRK